MQAYVRLVLHLLHLGRCRLQTSGPRCLLPPRLGGSEASAGMRGLEYEALAASRTPRFVRVHTESRIFEARLYLGGAASEIPRYTRRALPSRRAVGGSPLKPPCNSALGGRWGGARRRPGLRLLPFSLCLRVLLLYFANCFLFFERSTGLGRYSFDLPAKLYLECIKRSGLGTAWGPRYGHFNFWSHFAFACPRSPLLARPSLARSLARPFARSLLLFFYAAP